MEKIDKALFKKQEMSKEEQFFAKGGDSGRATSTSTMACDSTWVFWEDCETRNDVENDYDVLPAANNISSR